MIDHRLFAVGVIGISILMVGGGLGATGIGEHSGVIGQLARAAGIHGPSKPQETLFGNLIALTSLIRIGGGIALWKGERSGYLFTAVLSAILMLLDLGHLAHHTGLYGLGLNAIIAALCWISVRRRKELPA